MHDLMAETERARRFQDRYEAGRLLAEELRDYAGRGDVLVVALPRGGVPVGYEVARVLRAPLDAMQVRKLGVPGHEELAMGAIATGDVCVLNRGLMRELGISRDELEGALATAREELHRRELAYRGDRPMPPLAGQTVILVDDGLATGATMVAAVTALDQHDVARIVVAVPVASRESVQALVDAGRTVVALLIPEPFIGVGRWYLDFTPTSDEEVLGLLEAAWSRTLASSARP